MTADNDCFNGFSEPSWLRMLDRIEQLDGALFVTLPDVVTDADATLDRGRGTTGTDAPVGGGWEASLLTSSQQPADHAPADAASRLPPHNH